MISQLLDWLSDFLSRRKGLLPLIGIVLVITNYFLQWLIYPHWLAASNLFLHLGVLVAIFGLMLASAL
jgi:hypothetical protein